MDRRCFLKSLTAAPAVCLGHSSLIWTELALAQQRGGMAQPDPFKPSESANNPVGEARGVHPGPGGLGPRCELNQLGWQDGVLVG